MANSAFIKPGVAIGKRRSSFCFSQFTFECHWWLQLLAGQEGFPDFGGEQATFGSQGDKGEVSGQSLV